MNTPTNSTRKSSRSAAPREFLTYSAKNTQAKIIKQGPDAKLSPKKNPVGGSSSPTKKAKSVTSKVTPGAPQKPILTQEEKQELREEKLPEEKMETEVTTTTTPETTTTEVTTITPETTTEAAVPQETVQQDAHPTPQEEEEEEDWSQEQFIPPFVDPDEVREKVRLEKQAAEKANTTSTSTSSSSFSPLADKLKHALNTPVSGELSGQMQGITFQGEEEEEEEEEEVQVTGQKNKFGFLTKEFYDPKNQGVIPHQKPNGKYYNKEGREVDQYGFHPIGLYHSWDGVSAHQKPDGKRYNKEGKRVNRLFQELDHEGKLVNSTEEEEDE